jgi:hypothetical protein
MGICTYCHQKAGWFSDAHDACVQKAAKGAETIQTCMANAVVQGKQYDDIAALINKVQGEAAIPQDQVRSALQRGWSDGSDTHCKKQPISLTEFSAISGLYKEAGFQPEDMLKTPGFRAMTLSYLIWTVLHDQIDPYQGPIQFNLQSGEIPVFGMANVLLSEQKTMSSYIGGYSGASIRIANGVYYHLGGMQGHKVQNTSLQEVDYGGFLMTTRAIYFGGTERGTNFRLGYNSIIRFQPYSDGVGICKNGGREQIFAPQQIPDSGWWLFNLLQTLAAKASESMGHHA